MEKELSKQGLIEEKKFVLSILTHEIPSDFSKIIGALLASEEKELSDTTQKIIDEYQQKLPKIFYQIDLQKIGNLQDKEVVAQYQQLLTGTTNKLKEVYQKTKSVPAKVMITDLTEKIAQFLFIAGNKSSTLS